MTTIFETYKSFIPNNIDSVVYGVNRINDLQQLPFPTEPNLIYTLTRWDRCHYIQLNKDGIVEVVHNNGGDFMPNEEYLCIRPKH